MLVKCATCGEMVKINFNDAHGCLICHLACCEHCAGANVYQINGDKTADCFNEWKVSGFAYDTKAENGSDKQVEWANRIKSEVMRNVFNSFGRGYAGKLMLKYTQENRQTVVDKIRKALEALENCNDANFWIENRKSNISDYVALALQLAKKAPVKEEAKEVVKEETVEKETVETVIPENRKQEGVAVIEAKKDKVTVSYANNDKFKEIVKDLGYRWDGSNWSKMLSITTGSAKERMAEVGNKLLCAGFAIRIADPEIRKAAVEADYEPECKRWVLNTTNNKYFALTWEYGNDKLYKASRRISGSKYSKPYVLVPVAEYNAVLDLADGYGFKLAPGAQKLVQTMQGLSGLVVKPVQANETECKSVLDSSREVLNDLRDDD